MAMESRPFEVEDPMELTGMVLPGGPGQLETMAECLVDEYARMGWEEGRLMKLFVNPHFLATHRVYRIKGEIWVRDLVRRGCARWRPVARSGSPTEVGCEPAGVGQPRQGAQHV